MWREGYAPTLLVGAARVACRVQRIEVLQSAPGKGGSRLFDGGDDADNIVEVWHGGYACMRHLHTMAAVTITIAAKSSCCH